MSSQRQQQYSADSLASPRQRQQQYQEYSRHPSRSPNPQPYLEAPPRANSDSSSSLYSLSAYSTDIQGQPIQSPYSQATGLHASASTGSGIVEGTGEKTINLDDYLEELRIATASPESGGAGDQRGLTGLGFMGEAGAVGGFAPAPLSGKASPANIPGSSHASRSNTNDSTSIPLSSSMSSTTSSLSQYSMQQPQMHPSDLAGGSASPIVPGSLPERDSSLAFISNSTAADQLADLAASGSSMEKLTQSERERDLRRVSSDSAGSNDTYSGQTGTENRDLDMKTPTVSSMMGGQNVKQENLPTRLGGANDPASADASVASKQQKQPKIGIPGGTPLFDLASAATFAGPPIDISDDPTSPVSVKRTAPQSSTGHMSPTPQSQTSHGISSPTTTSASTSNTSDYLTAAGSAGNKATMTQMGGNTGLGIGMPQGGVLSPAPSDNRLTFDEGLLRTLCDLDCAMPLITERIKQSMTSCRQIAAFFRSRAELEDKYARGMNELVRGSADNYSRAFCKAGSFVEAFNSTLRVHDTLAQNRLRFAQRLIEMSEELTTLAKEGERLRKLHKEAGTRYEKNVQEAEFLMEKAKQRFDNTAEELERILVTKEGESIKDASGLGSGKEPKRGGIGKAMSKGLFKAKNPAQIQRQEDETRVRMNSASEQFKRAVQENQAVKQEFFNLHLPKILRQMKECADELDMGCQYHMARYAYLFETTLLADGSAILPVTEETGEKAGLKAIVETIDNRNDFKTFMQNFTVARGSQRGPSRNVPYDDGSLPAMPPHVHASHYGISQPPQQSYNPSSQQYPPATTASIYSNGDSVNSHHSQGFSIPSQQLPTTGMTFGVELSEQAVVPGTEIPKVVQKCTEAIEAFGLDQVGIYRLSGTTSKVQALKAALDQDLDNTDVMSDEWSGDINVVASVLKQWFRELPEPLLTHGLYQGFIEAARYENDRLRHIRLHEQVNELPDANYATLKHFMGHLDKIRSLEKVNHMTVSNLSIVFGPTLLGAPPEMGSLNLEHMSFQCKAIETILLKYKEIFVEEEDTSGAAPASK